MLSFLKVNRLLVVMGLVFVALAAGAAPVPRTEPAEPPVRAPSAGIDDMQVLRALETQIKALMDAGKTTPMKELVGQLSRTSCDVKLSKPAGQPLTPAQVYERCKPSVLVMGGVYKCEKCGKNHCVLASGFIIAETGVAVTNYHVVNEPKNLTLVAMKADGSVCPVKAVLAANAAGDVAIVQLGGTGFVPLAVAAAAPIGSDVFVISHPDSRFFTLSKGIVARYTTMTRGRKKGATMLQITAEYAKGSSGGPVLNTAGEVVGMVSSTMSVYYNDDHGKQQDLQMVFNDCVTSRQILDLIKSP